MRYRLLRWAGRSHPPLTSTHQPVASLTTSPRGHPTIPSLEHHPIPPPHHPSSPLSQPTHHTPPPRHHTPPSLYHPPPHATPQVGSPSCSRPSARLRAFVKVQVILKRAAAARYSRRQGTCAHVSCVVRRASCVVRRNERWLVRVVVVRVSGRTVGSMVSVQEVGA